MIYDSIFEIWTPNISPLTLPCRCPIHVAHGLYVWSEAGCLEVDLGWGARPGRRVVLRASSKCSPTLYYQSIEYRRAGSKRHPCLIGRRLWRWRHNMERSRGLCLFYGNAIVIGIVQHSSLCQILIWHRIIYARHRYRSTNLIQSFIQFINISFNRHVFVDLILLFITIQSFQICIVILFSQIINLLTHLFFLSHQFLNLFSFSPRCTFADFQEVLNLKLELFVLVFAFDPFLFLHFLLQFLNVNILIQLFYL